MTNHWFQGNHETVLELANHRLAANTNDIAFTVSIDDLPKAQEVLEKVENTYFIGTVDESSLSGNADILDATDVTGKASEGRYNGMMIFAVELHRKATLTRSESAALT